MIKNFLNGNTSVSNVYWGAFMCSSLGLRATHYLLGIAYLDAVDDDTITSLDRLSLAVTILAAVVFAALLRTMVLACFNNRRPGFWGWIGITLMLIATSIQTYGVFSLIFPNIAVPRAMLMLELNQFNKVLPSFIEEGIRMDHVSIVADDLIYSLTVQGNVLTDDPVWIADITNLNEASGQELCSDMEGYIRGGISNITYSYAFDDKTLESVLPAEDCLSFLNAR